MTIEPKLKQALLTDTDIEKCVYGNMEDYTYLQKDTEDFKEEDKPLLLKETQEMLNHSGQSDEEIFSGLENVMEKFPKIKVEEDKFPLDFEKREDYEKFRERRESTPEYKQDKRNWARRTTIVYSFLKMHCVDVGLKAVSGKYNVSRDEIIDTVGKVDSMLLSRQLPDEKEREITFGLCNAILGEYRRLREYAENVPSTGSRAIFDGANALTVYDSHSYILNSYAVKMVGGERDERG